MNPIKVENTIRLQLLADIVGEIEISQESAASRLSGRRLPNCGQFNLDQLDLSLERKFALNEMEKEER